MPVINFMGTELYIQVKPTFRGAKAPVLKKVPYTADSPTLPQRKARLQLAETAISLRDTLGVVGNTGHGKAGPRVALEIFSRLAGKTVGGESPADRKRRRHAAADASLAQLRKAAGA